MREGEIRGAPPHLGAWQHHGHPPPRGGDWVGGHPEEDPGGRSPGGKQNLIGSPTPLPTRWSPAPLERHVRNTTSLKVIGRPAPPPIRWPPAPHTRGTRPDHLRTGCPAQTRRSPRADQLAQARNPPRANSKLALFSATPSLFLSPQTSPLKPRHSLLLVKPAAISMRYESLCR